MSHVTRKPVFGVCDQVRLKPACSATEASLSLDSSDIETRSIILSRLGTTKVLIRLRESAGWSAPLLFAYGINRFSHDMAHILITPNWSVGEIVFLQYFMPYRPIQQLWSCRDGQFAYPHISWAGWRKQFTSTYSTSFCQQRTLNCPIWISGGERMFTLHELVNCLWGLPRNSLARLTDRARNDLKCVEGP